MMTCLDYHVGGVSIVKAVSELPTVPPDSDTGASARSVCICFGD
jgi:hypothetical protein